MIYNVQNDKWEYILYTSLKNKQEDFRYLQDRIFDDLDDIWIRKFNIPYFQE